MAIITDADIERELAGIAPVVDDEETITVVLPEDVDELPDEYKAAAPLPEEEERADTHAGAEKNTAPPHPPHPPVVGGDHALAALRAHGGDVEKRGRGRPRKPEPPAPVRPPVNVWADGLIENRLVRQAMKRLRDELEIDGEDLAVELIRWRALNDLYWFGATFLGMAQPDSNGDQRVDPKLHKELARRLSADDHSLILIPRGHCKSSWAEVAALQDVLREPDSMRVLIISLSQDVATTRLRGIAAKANSAAVLGYFPDIVPEPGRDFSNWDTKNKYDLTIQPAATRRVAQHQFSACGWDKLITGQHFDRILMDDVVDYASTRSAERRDKAADRLTELNSIRDPKGRVTVLGTRYHPDDLYSRMMKGSLGRNPFVKTATERTKRGLPPPPAGVREGSLDDEHSEVIYSYFTKEHLRELRADAIANQGSDFYFNAQYYNEAVVRTDALFTKENIVTYKRGELPDRDVLAGFVGVDTANTRHKDSDFSAVVVAYRDQKTGLIYLDEAVAVKERWEDLAQRVIKMACAMTVPPQTIMLETTMKDQWETTWDREMSGWVARMEVGKAVEVVRPVFFTQKRGAEKVDRINLSLGTAVRTGTVRIREGLKELLLQMLDMPVGRHDDLPDAASIAVQAADPYNGISFLHSFNGDGTVAETREERLMRYLLGGGGSGDGWAEHGYSADFNIPHRA